MQIMHVYQGKILQRSRDKLFLIKYFKYIYIYILYLYCIYILGNIIKLYVFENNDKNNLKNTYCK